MTDPLPITAICVSRPGREGLLLRAVASFLEQSWPNKQLLVWAAGSTLQRLGQMFSAPQTDSVLRLERSGGSPWDDLREGLIRARKADGLVALWPDDQQSHPLRLARQAHAALIASKPCYLSAGLWWYPDSAELVAADLEVRQQPLRTRILPSTLVAETRALPAFAWPAAQPTSPTAALGWAVQAAGDSVRLSEWQWLVQTVRGDNALGYEWHRSICSRYALDPSPRRAELQFWVDQYRWDVSELDACGREKLVPLACRRRWSPQWPGIGRPDDEIIRTQEKID